LISKTSPHSVKKFLGGGKNVHVPIFTIDKILKKGKKKIETFINKKKARPL